jgi:WD repeat-containing protein 48
LDSVWTLAGDPSQCFYSGGKDGSIYHSFTSTVGSGADSATLFCQQEDGIQALQLNDQLIWSATCRSTVYGWQAMDSISIQFPSSETPDSEGDDSFTDLQSEKVDIYGDSHLVWSSCHYMENDKLQEPHRTQPQYCCQGQAGLIRHRLLTNKRNVVTLDSDGCVDLWDILQCLHVRTFGIKNFDDVCRDLNPLEFRVHWCSIDTNIGALSVTLNNSSCFDAETYVDECGLSSLHFPKDQRINIGRWVLLSLFRALLEALHQVTSDSENCSNEDHLAHNVRTSGYSDSNGQVIKSIEQYPSILQTQLSRNSSLGHEKDKNEVESFNYRNLRGSEVLHSRTQSIINRLKQLSLRSQSSGIHGCRTISVSTSAISTVCSSARSSMVSESTAPVPLEIFSPASSLLSIDGTCISCSVESFPTPSAPIQSFPAPIPIDHLTNISILGEFQGACSSLCQWFGKVQDTGDQASALLQVAPPWLLDLLLHDRYTSKEPVKIGFMLTPHPDSDLPPLRSGDHRLLANRLVRVRRMLNYVVEHTGLVLPPRMNVEDYVELVLNDQPLDPSLTLATIRTHLWKGNNEMDLHAHYRRKVNSSTSHSKPIHNPEPMQILS